MLTVGLKRIILLNKTICGQVDVIQRKLRKFCLNYNSPCLFVSCRGIPQMAQQCTLLDNIFSYVRNFFCNLL